MNRANEMKRVRDLISYWLTRINFDNSVDYFDINKKAEHVAMPLDDFFENENLEKLTEEQNRKYGIIEN